MSVRARSFVGALSLAFWLGALAVGCRTTASSSQDTAPAAPQGQVEAVSSAVEKWRLAYEERSVETLAKLYAKDEVILVQQGSEARGWTALEAILTSRLGNAKEVRVRLKDLAVAPLGEAGATIVAAMTREISDGVTTVTEEGRLTLALRDSGGGVWTIVSEHYSYLPR